MTSRGRLDFLIRRLRRVAEQTADGATDASLLERFVAGRDEAAFELLLWRHGPMVRGVCRRVLANTHAAEDAFQAVFMVLARRAAAIRPRAALAAWLHGVSYRVALKARAAGVKRRARETPASDLAPADPRPDPLAELTARDLLTAVDEEVLRLPEVYRLPLVLCCLEGRTQEEAARLLGWTAGSVKGRLERGRKRLHARLLRRGLTLAALGTVELWRDAASVAASATLTTMTATAFPAGKASANAAALAEGILKTVFSTNLKIATAFLLTTAVVALAGATMLCQTWPPNKQEQTPMPNAKADATPEEDPALGRLIRSLGAGPIRVRFADHAKGAVSEEEAVKAAKRAVGADGAPEKAWRVAVTDREFMSGLVDDKPCWLLRYPDAVALPLSFEGKDTRTLSLYVVVDAASGRLWEAFTEPEAPWWERVKKKNRDVVRLYADRGDEATADPDPPGVPLLRLLNARAQAFPDLPAGNEYGAQRKAQQVIARHFLYTTAVDTEERTEKGVRRFRSHDREPVWTIEFDGVDLPPPVGPPRPDADLTPEGLKTPPAVQPNVERIDAMWNATSGRSLSTGMSP